MSQHGWIGFDLDGTLAHYEKWVSASHIGPPVEPMLNLLKKYMSSGQQVRIFTARVYPLVTVHRPEDQTYHELDTKILADAFDSTEERVQSALDALTAIRSWCREHVGEELSVTCVKDFSMILLFDDRAVQVERNTGRVLTEESKNA